MSTIMMLRVKGDAGTLEQYTKAHADQMCRVAEESKNQGAIHHCFAGGNGEVVVIDEWPTEEAFQKFFDSQSEISKIMQGAGTQGKPEITFYRKLDTPDEF